MSTLTQRQLIDLDNYITGHYGEDEPEDDELSLLPHQTQALDAAINQKAFAFLMPTGSGKTFTVLEEITRLYKAKEINKAIIITPKKLLKQWQKAMREWPPLKDIEYQVFSEKRFYFFSNILNIYLLNVETFSRNTKKSLILAKLTVLSPEKTYIALDESTKIKNPSTNRTKVLIELANIFGYTRIMTGSPITESPLEVYSQFKFLDKSIFPESFFNFKRRYTIIKKNWGPYGSFKQVDAYYNIDELVNRIKPYSFYIKKEDCLVLPEKVYNDIEYEVTVDTKKRYNTLVKQCLFELQGMEEPKVIIHAIDMMYKLQEILNVDANKHETLKEIIDLNPKSKIIIYINRIYEIDMLETLLKETYPNKRIGFITGPKVSNNLESFDFILATQQSASYGFNLQFANVIVYYNNVYSLEIRQQSEDRIHRIGQAADQVLYYNIYAVNTIEENIMNVLDVKKLTASEFMALFKEVK